MVVSDSPAYLFWRRTCKHLFYKLSMCGINAVVKLLLYVQAPLFSWSLYKWTYELMKNPKRLVLDYHGALQHDPSLVRTMFRSSSFALSENHLIYPLETYKAVINMSFSKGYYKVQTHFQCSGYCYYMIVFTILKLFSLLVKL